MRASFLVRYFIAGVVLTNGVPHFAVSLTGRRNMTPFGRNSSPRVNLLWGAINFLGGILLLRWTDREAAVDPDSHAWLLTMLAGGLFWSALMVVIEASGFTHRQR